MNIAMDKGKDDLDNVTDSVTEANEYFDCVLYPEQEEKIQKKQGLTIIGSSDGFNDALEV